LRSRSPRPAAMKLIFAAVLTISWEVRSDFVASLHSNYVVNLDFDGSESALTDADPQDVKVMSFAGGKRKFRCAMPGAVNATADASSTQTADAKAQFLAAKLKPLQGTCSSVATDYWTFDICFGRKIVQHRSDADLRFSLGEHHAASDRLLPTGEVRELYLGGTDNRTTEVRYFCGTAEKDTQTIQVTEDPNYYYTINVSGPAFCTWKEKDGTETTAASGKLMKVSALLEPLRGHCLNHSAGWWTYEYCFPTKFVQFHLEGNKRDPQYTLGTMEGSTETTASDRVNMSMIRLKPSMSPRERRAPPSGHLTLQQRFGGGTVCDETNRPRQTVLHFQCPANWQSRPEPQVVSLTESALCEYEVLVHTTLLCGHHKMMPTLPRGKKTIQCVAQPEVN